jgi:hypothetical protein
VNIVSQATPKTFEEVARDFAQFAKSQGFPPRLLGITPDDIVFWIGSYFVFRGDAEKRELQARTTLDVGIARSMGIELGGRCMTLDLTICRFYVPADDIDAQYRMIPQPGVTVKSRRYGSLSLWLPFSAKFPSLGDLGGRHHLFYGVPLFVGTFESLCYCEIPPHKSLDIVFWNAVSLGIHPS